MDKGGMIMFCIKCGNQLNEGSAFCTNCGTPAGAASQTPQAPQAPQDGTSINVTYGESSQQVIPYVPPVIENGNIIIPVHRRYWIFCPDCGHVTDSIKKDTSAGYPGVQGLTETSGKQFPFSVPRFSHL